MRIETIQSLEKISNFPIISFLMDVEKFFQFSYPKLIKFYDGKTDSLDKSNIELLNSLLFRVNELTTQFKINKTKLKTVDFWEMLEEVEDIKTQLQTSANLPKYLRSSITNSSYTKGIQYQYVLSDGETMERVSDKVLFDKTPENDWSDIALKNDLREVDWSIKGGTQLTLTDKSFQAGLVTSMIDNTIGERIYGKDIKKKLEFDSTENDLVILGYKDTAYQTVTILSSLEKGDIPEFPSLGLNGSIYKGSSFAQVLYSSIIRELNKIFASDDLFSDFRVTSLKYLNGDIFVEFSVGTKFNLVIVKTIAI